MHNYSEIYRQYRNALYDLSDTKLAEQYYPSCYFSEGHFELSKDTDSNADQLAKGLHFINFQRVYREYLLDRPVWIDYSKEKDQTSLYSNDKDYFRSITALNKWVSKLKKHYIVLEAERDRIVIKGEVK